MSSNLVLKAIRAFLLVAVAGAAAVGLFMVLGGMSPLDYWRIKLPRERDSRLVGTWVGKWRLLDGEPVLTRTVTLDQNGTGSWTNGSTRYRRFDWGTEDGVFYTRRMATDAWSGSSTKYSITPDGSTATFLGARQFGPVAKEMRLKR